MKEIVSADGDLALPTLLLAILLSQVHELVLEVALVLRDLVGPLGRQLDSRIVERRCLCSDGGGGGGGVCMCV